MKGIKRAIVFLLCIVTVFGALSACAKKPDPDTDETKNANMIGSEPIAFDDTDAYLVDGGKSDYKIAVSADPSRIEKYAAEELCDFIEQSTAVTLPIVSDDEVSHDNNARYISVGATKLLAAQSDIKADYAELGENGVIVKTQVRVRHGRYRSRHAVRGLQISALPDRLRSVRLRLRGSRLP